MINKVIITLISLLFIGCASQEQIKIVKSDAFPGLYSNSVKSMLVVPFINNTSASDASNIFSATLLEPIAEAGYYVLPINESQQILIDQGVLTGDHASSVDFSKYRNLFGADTVMFISINSWDTNYKVFSGSVSVSINFRLFSTTTNELLWWHNESATQKTTSGSGILETIILTAISTAITDYASIAKKVNYESALLLPKGIHHPDHGRDNNDLIDASQSAPLASIDEIKKANEYKFNDDKAYLYVLRTDLKASTSPKVTISINEECSATLGASMYIIKELTPGEEYTIKSEIFNSTSHQKIKPTAGSEHYLIADPLNLVIQYSAYIGYTFNISAAKNIVKRSSLARSECNIQ